MRNFGIKRATVILIFILLTGISGFAGEVPDSAEDVNPLPVGSQIPQLILKTVDGEPFDLNAAVAQQPTILIFFRGGW